MEGMLYLEDGQVYRGKGFGAFATNVGELVFNTGMTGYQELLTDPAVKGTVINMTYPQIGNYGISEIDNQSDSIHAAGLVTHDITFRPSNRCSVMNISDWLGSHGVPGVYNVDTREIMRVIRSRGTQKCVISTEGISKERAAELIESVPLRSDYMRDTGVELRMTRPGSAAESAPGRGLRIAVLDFGVKRGMVAELTSRGCDVILCPYSTTAEEILSMNPDGLLLPSGPGDPNEGVLAMKTTESLMGKLPIFGICTGHLILALAAGGKIYKMKFGHHGGNHGVVDLDSGKAVITSQGHGFAVDANSLKGSGMVVSHINLNDGTVEGMRHESLPVFSVQFHPEGASGPHDSKDVFDRFINMALAVKAGEWKGGKANA